MIRSNLSSSLLGSACLFFLAACGATDSGDAMPAEEAGSAAPAPAETAMVPEAEGADHDHEAEADHDHDHNEEEGHASGSAHVHGIADLALTVEDGKLTAEMISPLANFGLAEADGVFSDDVISALPELVSVTGGDCVADAPVPEIDTTSGHTDGHVRFSWACARPDGVTAVRFDGFQAFPGFETVNAVFVTDAVQRAAELTPSSPEFSLK